MKKMDFISLLKSMIFFLKLLFVKHKYDIVFIYPNHFNRGKNGGNYFFVPLIESCKKNNIKYIVFEDTDLKGAYRQYPRSDDAIPFDFITFLRILYRKLYVKKKLVIDRNDQYYVRERAFSTLLKKTLFKNFDFNVCISMASDNSTFFRGLNSTAIVCIYQHGVIYNGHLNYLMNHKADDYITKDNALFLVHGKGYKQLLINQDTSKYYNQKNVVDIGINPIVTKYNGRQKINNKVILFSLQITPDTNYDILENYIDIIQKLFQTAAQYLEENGYLILFKHHPRFDANKCPNIKIDHSNMKLVEDFTLENLLLDSSIHMTFNSTSSFEAGLQGIPTIFIDVDKIFSPNDIYYNQFDYPLNAFRITKGQELEYILKELENIDKYEKHSNTVYSWAKHFYNDYNEEKLLSLMSEIKNDII